MPLAVGTRLGPYVVSGVLGAGGMGEVYKGRDTRLDRDVAVKVLPSLFSADADRLRRFEHEARAAAALNHPNILVVYDVGTDGGVPYVVELLEGQTLRQVLERGALPARKAVDYGIQIASGLAAAHEKGIVHRDLKPENLFVTKDGRVKILDFGLAKLVEAAATDGAGETVAHTDPGMVVGTAGYMSPEQLRGEPVDARSDIFSLGCVLYEMFTGARAFKGKTAVDTMSAILKEDPADFGSSPQAVSPALERIVRRCLEKSVDERFQSARDVTFALEAMSTGSGIRPPDGVVVPARRARPLPLAAAALLAALVGLAGYAIGTRTHAAIPASPAVTQLTFRNGDVRGARFSPDGKTVVYAAAWEGQPLQIYSMRPGSPESSQLNLPGANVLAISSTGEMAIALNHRFQALFSNGTLARVPLSGGAPRLIAEDVVSADYSRDGHELAATFSKAPADGRLEFPIGSIRLTTHYWLSGIRISPDGSQVAFIAHPGYGDDGNIEVIGRTGAPRTISDGWLSVDGLVWARGGRELWVTGTRAGMLRALWSISLDGRERLVYRAPIRLQLEDVAPDGRALLTAGSTRTQIRFGSIANKTERSLSWFDYGSNISLSDDAKTMAFLESGEGAGSSYGIFVRPTDGGAAYRLADGQRCVISPDGKWVVAALPDPTGRTGRLVPTGPGTIRDLAFSSLERLQGLSWFHDNRRLILLGNEPGRPPRSFVYDIATARLTPLTPEGVTSLHPSPDGHWLAALDHGKPGSFDLQTQTFTAIPAPQTPGPAGGLAGWSADSKAVFAVGIEGMRAHVVRVEVLSGKTTPLITLSPPDAAGGVDLGNVRVAPDGDHYVYGYGSKLSELFLVDLSGR